MEIYKTDEECRELINLIYKKSSELHNKIATTILLDSKNISLSANKDFKNDEIFELNKLQEFCYILGLAIYDIFSNNHEVITSNHEIFDLGSFRGSGDFLADFLNDYLQDNKPKYNYLDFYMGTSWIKKNIDLLPFYEFIFNVLKDEKYDWIYFFPRMQLVDLSNHEVEVQKEENPQDYNPENAMKNEFESLEKKQSVDKLQNEFDNIFEKQFEEAKYKQLIPIVQAYKNIYGYLPHGHPQKEFE